MTASAFIDKTDEGYPPAGNRELLGPGDWRVIINLIRPHA